MTQISVKEESVGEPETGRQDGWVFEVNVGGGSDVTVHKVSVPKEYWQALTDGKEEPLELVRRSFEFLLEREPKESILRRFNLRDIEKYFPEYPKVIRQQ